MNLVCMRCKSEQPPRKEEKSGEVKLICNLCGHHGTETFTPEELFADKTEVMEIWKQPKYEGVRVY